MEKLSYTFCKMAGILKQDFAHENRVRVRLRKFLPPPGKAAIFSILFFLVLAAAAVPLSAEEKAATGNGRPAEKSVAAGKNMQRIIPLSSPVYREMERLYLLAGKSLPSTARPWSADEAALVFEEISGLIDDEKFEPSFSIIKKEIFSGTGKTGAGKADYRITTELNLEGYYKTTDDRDEWEHGYEERKPLLYVPIEAWFFENLYSTVDLTIKEEYAAITDIENNRTSIFTNPTQLDWYFPFRAFISVGGKHWNIQAGRDQASWGAGRTGNLMLSDYSEFYNLLRVTTYWERFKFSAIYIGLDPWLTKEEKAFDEEGRGLAGGYQNFGELFKAYLGHRAEFRVTEKLAIAVSEATIFGNKYINFTELNPVFVFHNLFTPEYSNAIFALEADYTILPGLNLYLQFVMDEFQVPGYESSDTRPGATGLLGGFTLVKPLESGFLTFNVESAVTEPYLYNRWHPLTRFTNRRRMWSTVLDSYAYINKPIGYEHGPDALVFYFSTEYEKPGLFSAAIDARYSLKGSMNSSLDDYNSYETGKDASSLGILSGTVEKELVTGLHGTIALSDTITLSSDIYWINIYNYGNESGRKINDFETALSAGFRF